ncbi:cyclase [Candidatus Methylomirabilis lanthanidiphila]|uniref:Cyclase n=1 Tax=Candidatus Methylomirabilis lanthanidiphila TaxID=2211376 RepID=A0A564ZK03_9BACT|nr:ester cyclase [Candidatus Methylomirabilis lanthanidiphila]VUZ85503.1 cyclase [Candidatus Methylomirabilis lanthanidiphila]
MSTEDNKRLVRRLYAEGFQFSAMDEFFSPDLIYHDPPPIPGLRPGIEAIKQTFRTFASAAPEGNPVIHDLIAEGDLVVVRMTAAGLHTGELFGVPPTGKRLEMTGIVIYRFEDGKIVERWAQHDFLGLMYQLGLIGTKGHESSSHPDELELGAAAQRNA